jgi:tetratricopeptide (TPR) repeat protein
MKVRRVVMPVLLAVLAAGCSAVLADVASESFERGKALLAKGSLHAALGAYADAVRADRDNQAYLQEFMLVRQAVALEQAFAREKESGRWLQTAQALRSFYVRNGVYAKALRIDQQIHKRQDTESSALQLAETQLAMGKCVDAEQVLSALGPERTRAAQAMLAVALARQDKLDEARRLAKSITAPTFCDPGTLYSIARMRAAVGDTTECLAVLTRCFQATPPSRLETLKDHAKKSPEFSAMASTASFQAVLQTDSMVPESKCSGGASCAGCPMRRQCPSIRNK